MTQGKLGIGYANQISIITVDLSANNLIELKSFTFGALKKTLNLNLSENKLNFLPENLFEGSTVGYLNFANNLIDKLDPNCFENARLAVRKADFSNNKIELLDEKLFDNWIILEELNLSHNQIKVLPEKLFNYIKDSLNKVSFAANEISKIGYNTFINCTKLGQIDLRNNTLFDVAFDDHSRGQHEVCSNFYKDNCFIVNNYNQIIFELGFDDVSPGVLKSEQKCEEGKWLIRGLCRYKRN